MMLGLRLKILKSGGSCKRMCSKRPVNFNSESKLRMLPPLTITKEEIDKGIAVLKLYCQNKITIRKGGIFR